jgi:hypothetical protein
MTWKEMNGSNNNLGIFQNILRSNNSSKYLLTGMVNMILILLATSLLGISFMLMAQGVLLVSFSLANFWKPAFIFTSKIVGFNDTDVEFSTLSLKWWQIPIWLIRIGARVMLIGVGVWVIIRYGFCGQNFICMMVR